jgi:hypothetical protein
VRACDRSVFDGDDEFAEMSGRTKLVSASTRVVRSLPLVGGRPKAGRVGGCCCKRKCPRTPGSRPLGQNPLSNAPALDRSHLAGGVVNAHAPSAAFRGGAHNPCQPPVDAPRGCEAKDTVDPGCLGGLGASAITSSRVIRVLGVSGPNKTRRSSLNNRDILSSGCVKARCGRTAACETMGFAKGSSTRRTEYAEAPPPDRPSAGHPPHTRCARGGGRRKSCAAASSRSSFTNWSPDGRISDTHQFPICENDELRCTQLKEESSLASSSNSVMHCRHDVRDCLPTLRRPPG